ncbi:hypothetical protein C1645_204146 [Glomus cerebriforme]|uniref:Uncharacterized protein n=1 Tax=Glomus cerebriforme TaxID=658196 RepID=A0A397STK6_9GLOM|nr:hypothetical protein C1645_204146 [Glomus cerebriforme]
MGKDARRIDRIPFSTLVQIYEFIKILRQQLVFNALYQSCFNSSNYKQITITKPSKHDYGMEDTNLDAEEAEAKIQIKVQTDNPPNGLSLSIQLPPKMISPQITIHLNINILQEDYYVISQITGFGNISKLDDQELTRILQTYRDIPMLINHLLNNLLNPPNVEGMKLEEIQPLEEIKLEEIQSEEPKLEIKLEETNLGEINSEENKMMIDDIDVNPYLIYH